MGTSTKVKAYSILRVIAILLVLISHMTYYKVGNAFGGIDYLALAPSGTSFKWYFIFDKVRYVIYLFHMPLFMALYLVRRRFNSLLLGAAYAGLVSPATLGAPSSECLCWAILN